MTWIWDTLLEFAWRGCINHDKCQIGKSLDTSQIWSKDTSQVTVMCGNTKWGLQIMQSVIIGNKWLVSLLQFGWVLVGWGRDEECDRNIMKPSVKVQCCSLPPTRQLIPLPCKQIIPYLYMQPSSWRWTLGFETCTRHL
jgi:hypothetical protein